MELTHTYVNYVNNSIKQVNKTSIKQEELVPISSTMLLANSEKDCIISTLMGFIHSFPQHVPFLPVQIEGLWGGSALIKHNRHLATVDLRDSESKSLRKPD